MQAKKEARHVEWLTSLLALLTLVGLAFGYVLIEDHTWTQLASNVLPNLIATVLTVLVIYWAFKRRSIPTLLQSAESPDALLSDTGAQSQALTSEQTSDVTQDDAAEPPNIARWPNIAGSPIAGYDDYPIVVSQQGRLRFDEQRARSLAKRIVADGDQTAAYELIYLVEDIAAHKYSTTSSLLDLELLESLRSLVPISLQRQLSTERNAVVSSMVSVIRGLGKTFASCGIEFVLHDARNPLYSVISIENSITGRSIHAPNTNFGVRLLRMYARTSVAENYCSYRLRINDLDVKSSTFPILDQRRHLVALFCVNMALDWYSLIDHDSDNRRLLELLRALGHTDTVAKIDELIKGAPPVQALRAEGEALSSDGSPPPWTP